MTLIEVAQVESSGDLAVWSPEMRVILACARDAPSAEIERNLREIPDLGVLLSQCERHGFTSLLYRRLIESSEMAVPSAMRDALSERYRSNIQYGLHHTRVLIEVMDLFRTASLTALPYKGPVLSAQIFGDAALREAVDLDILLPQEEVMAACRLLEARGFQPLRAYRPGIEKQLLRYRAEIGLMRDGVLVELQWRLAPNYFSVPVDIRSLARRSSTVTVAGAELPALNVEDNLLVLCVHGAKHHWQCLKWLLDVDRLVRRNPGISWVRVQEQARDAGVHRILGLGLSLCNNLLQTPLPSEIQQAIDRDRSLAALRGIVMQGLQSNHSPAESEHHRLMLQLRERLSDRLWYLLRLGWQPTESEWEAIALPRPLHFAYHMVRVGRVLAKAFGRAPG